MTPAKELLKEWLDFSHRVYPRRSLDSGDFEALVARTAETLEYEKMTALFNGMKTGLDLASGPSRSIEGTIRRESDGTFTLLESHVVETPEELVPKPADFDALFAPPEK